MTEAEIIFLVQCVTGIAWSSMVSAQKGKELNAKYVAVLMMHEEGYKPGKIAYLIQRDRTSVYWVLGRIEGLIMESKEFKTMYLACIKRMAEMEEQQCA